MSCGVREFESNNWLHQAPACIGRGRAETRFWNWSCGTKRGVPIAQSIKVPSIVLRLALQHKAAAWGTSCQLCAEGTQSIRDTALQKGLAVQARVDAC